MEQMHLYIYSMSDRQSELMTKVVGIGLGMFKFVLIFSQPIGGHPLTDTLFITHSVEAQTSQPVEHPLWPCTLRVVSMYFCPPLNIYIIIYIYKCICISIYVM